MWGEESLQRPTPHVMPDQAAVYYNSIYRHGVDEKRRLQIPAKWRPGKEDFEFTLILWPGSEGRRCILALPPDPLKRLVDKITAMPYSGAKSAQADFLKWSLPSLCLTLFPHSPALAPSASVMLHSLPKAQHRQSRSPPDPGDECRPPSDRIWRFFRCVPASKLLYIWDL